MKVSMKLTLCLALGLVLLCGGAWLWGAKTSASRQQIAADIQRVRNEGLVRDRHREDIESAKEQGKKEIILPATISIPTVQLPLEELLRNSGLFRVKVIDKQATVSEPYANIMTWYKVEIVETLHQQGKMINDEPLPDGAPSRFLSLLPSESLLVVSGGEVTVDGVRVVRGVSTDENHFIPKEEYLIVGYLDYGGKLIRPSTGRAGVFQINNTHLKSFGQKEHRLVREIEERYGDDLDLLRSDVQLRLRRGN
jgi:hypothetical protein